MQLKVLKFYEDSLLLLLLYLLMGPCPVFYPVCLFFCDVNVQFLHQRFGGHPGGFFLSFAIFAGQLSSTPFTWFPHARFLILVHLMAS
jgi:hypothetical protein